MSAALLLDENFPAPSTALLRAANLDVVAIGEVTPGLSDSAVLSRAVSEQRWLVTFDRDYGELIFVRGHAPPPAVLLLRVASYRPQEPAIWVMRLLANQTACLGRFVVFDGDAIRSRPLLGRVGGGTR